jgi:hypothetical protein
MSPNVMLFLMITSEIVRITPAVDNYVGLRVWPLVDDPVEQSFGKKCVCLVVLRSSQQLPPRAQLILLRTRSGRVVKFMLPPLFSRTPGKKKLYCGWFQGARGSAVRWDTALHVGRSRVRFPIVSLEFFIGTILPAALWPWGSLSL